MHTQYWRACKFLRYVRRIQFHTHFRLYYFLYIRLKKKYERKKYKNEIKSLQSNKILDDQKMKLLNYEITRLTNLLSTTDTNLITTKNQLLAIEIDYDNIKKENSQLTELLSKYK